MVCLRKICILKYVTKNSSVAMNQIFYSNIDKISLNFKNK